MTPKRPAISVILGTDTYETIRPVVECLRRQTVKDRVELVIIAPRRASLGMSDADGEGLAAVQFVEVGDVSRLAVARAAGVRAATAPIVVIGETHTYPDPRWAEALIRAHEGQPWAVIVPGFGNANPNGPLSWAIFLLDYGAWLAGLPAGEIGLAPTHNASYKREVLLSIPGAGDGPRPWGRVDPPAQVRRSPRVLRTVGGDRSPQRHPARALAPRALPGRPRDRRTARDALALVDAAPRMPRSPLIPVVILSRIWRGVRWTAAGRDCRSAPCRP